MAASASKSHLYDLIIGAYHNGLLESALKLAEIGISLKDIGENVFSDDEFTCVCAIMADIYSAQKEYSMAEPYVDRILALGSTPLSTGLKMPNHQNTDKVLSLHELKHHKALCMVESGRHVEALRLLFGIPWTERSVKVQMLMGDLYRHIGCLTGAVMQYKGVLEENEFAFEAAERLVQLGVNLWEIEAIVSQNPWLSPWVRGMGHLRSGRFEGTIKAMNESIFRNIPQGLAAKGKAYYCHGNYKMAMELLEKAHKLMPSMKLHMDTLAYLYAASHAPKKDLCHQLAQTLRNYSPEHPTTLVCTSLAMLASGNCSLAWTTIQKVVMSESSEAVQNLVIGTICFRMKKYKEAIHAMHVVIEEDPFCFDAYDVTVRAHLRCKMWDEAKATATCARSKLGFCHRILTMDARVLLRSHSLCWPLRVENDEGCTQLLDSHKATLARAKALLKLALGQDPGYIPAVFLMVEVCRLLDMFDEALLVLGLAADNISIAKLHCMMGEIYLEHKRDEASAVEAYKQAIKLDPDDQCAKMGLEAIGGPLLCSLSDVSSTLPVDDDEDTSATSLSHVLVTASVSSSGCSRPGDSSNSYSPETGDEEDLPDHEEYNDEDKHADY